MRGQVMHAEWPDDIQVSDEPAGRVYLLPARDQRPFRRFGGFFALFSLVVFGVGALMVRVGDAAGAEFIGWFLAVPCFLLGAGILALGVLALTGMAQSRTRILLNKRELIAVDQFGPLRRKLTLAVAGVRELHVGTLVPGESVGMARIQVVTADGLVRTLAPGYPASLLGPLAADLRQRCGLAEPEQVVFEPLDGLPDAVPPP